MSAEEICFDVVVRTDTKLDTGLSEMRVLVDGKPARVGAEAVTVRDYVMERRGEVCRSTNRGTKKGELALEVIIVQDDSRGNWGEKFVWLIE